MRDPLFFIALLPDKNIQKEVMVFKRDSAELFNASHALTSPPHITLYPPFPWNPGNLKKLAEAIHEFAALQESFYISLKGFNCFKPRVIYVDVEPNKILARLQMGLVAHLKNEVGLEDEKGIRFHAHMTIAHRDLKHSVFPRAWLYFSKKTYDRRFKVESLSLMEHKKGRWEVYKKFPLG